MHSSRLKTSANPQFHALTSNHNCLWQEDFMHINLTHIEAAVARLIDQQQEAVVVSAHHPLSRHKAIAAALWKARRLRAEPALEHEAGKGGRRPLGRRRRGCCVQPAIRGLQPWLPCAVYQRGNQILNQFRRLIGVLA
jgi:hypothetical protein